MNPQIPIEARQVVLDFITAGTSFTAYEVTLEVRRRLGTSIDVPHGVVNQIVQNMFARGDLMGYDRSSDQTVQSATKPFRYYQRGGAVAAPFASPTAPAISRSGLPVALQFSAPFTAMMRNLSIAARDFGRARGKADEPFAVWLPTLKEPTFRLRCYGAGWDKNEIERRFALDLNHSGDADLRWLAPLAYADEFRVYSNLSGTQRQFLIEMDAALQTTVTEEAERATGEPDGLEIEVAVRNREIDSGESAQKIYRYLQMPPRLYRDGVALQIVQPQIKFDGDGWKLTDNREPLAIVGEVAYSLLGLEAVAGLGVELYLKDVDVEPSLEKLVQTDRTRAARGAAIARFKSEVAAPINQRIEGAVNLWEAKIAWAEIFGNVLGGNALRNLLGDAVSWRGIALTSGNFSWVNSPEGVKVRQYLPSALPNLLESRTVYALEAHLETLIFINDLGFDTSPASRLKEFYQTTPFRVAYVLSFEDEAARARFFREQNFESVPTHLISQLPKPARVVGAARSTNRAPFDAKLHQIKAPLGGVAASFASGDDGSDDDYRNLKSWAQTAPLDEKNWPDFKRLYKAIEARLWPPPGRFRWEQSESDFPATPLPSARDLELLGVLMGRLDERHARRGTGAGAGAGAPVAPQPTIAQRALGAVNTLIGRAGAATAGAPSADTLAYMKRRATKLLVFLRDHKALSHERRDALAPLVSGLLQRPNCADINATLALRLKLTQTDVLARHPEAIARVWASANVSINIARWSYNWLENLGQTIAVSPAQLQRFAELPDVEMTLKLVPATLQNSQIWAANFGIQEFSRILQGNGQKTANGVWINSEFLKRRDKIVNLFARFPQLVAEESWLRDSLGEVDDEITLDWLAPYLTKWAQNGELALLEKMSEALQIRYNMAIVAAHPAGFTFEKWRDLAEDSTLISALAPALRELPITGEIVDFIWSLPAGKRDAILSALEDNPALLPIIEDRARQLDFAFIAPLSPRQWTHFARVVGQMFPAGIGAESWAQIATLPFESGYDELPLGASFWPFVLPLENERRAQWIARVGAQRAKTEFAAQSAAVFEQLLDGNAAGLETLGDAWLDANLKSVPLDGELIIVLAQSAVSDWQTRALQYLQSAELRLPVALRFMESELPILERVATPFFENENNDWSDRVLALADSPKMAARALALQLLAAFPARWTPELLRHLAQHDDAGIQAFVAAQLKSAPAKIVESKAIDAFDHAIINARGRARRAKESVKSRVSEGAFDRETLLEAARNGAPRDREWALKQLVLAALAGADVSELEVDGAFARAD